MRTAEAFATVFEQHRRVLRRHAARLLRGTGHDPDDVLQDVYLRAHAALEAGVVPIEMRAWLLRLVRNACLDELRRSRSRPVGDVVLEAVPAAGAAAARRAVRPRTRRGRCSATSTGSRTAEVRAGHERAGRAVARGGRRPARHDGQHDPLAAGPRPREPAPDRHGPRDRVRVGRWTIEEAALAGVRASELARRHLWSCTTAARSSATCASTPSRLRRLASWSPWAVLAQFLGGGGKAAVGVCCALVVGGGAVTVPVVEHARHAPKPVVLASTDDAAPALPPAGTRPRARRARRQPGT